MCPHTSISSFEDSKGDSEITDTCDTEPVMDEYPSTDGAIKAVCATFTDAIEDMLSDDRRLILSSLSKNLNLAICFQRKGWRSKLLQSPINLVIIGMRFSKKKNIIIQFEPIPKWLGETEVVIKMEIVESQLPIEAQSIINNLFFKVMNMKFKQAVNLTMGIEDIDTTESNMALAHKITIARKIVEDWGDW